MSKEFQIERHKTLWEGKTKQAKRIVYAGLLFSVLIFVNVLTPYSKNSEDKKNIELKLNPYLLKIQEIEKSAQPLNERLQELNLSSQHLNERLQHLNELEKVINNIEMLVKEAPWETETHKLIKKFQDDEYKRRSRLGQIPS